MAFSLDIAARTLWMEARGEPESGQRAVASVIVNRSRDGRWGHTLASVCLWPLQFSSWNTNEPNRRMMAELSDDEPLLAELAGFVQDALDGGQDPTNGALYYYATSIPQPAWAANLIFCGQFGRQRFFKEPNK